MVVMLLVERNRDKALDIKVTQPTRYNISRVNLLILFDKGDYKGDYNSWVEIRRQMRIEYYPNKYKDAYLTFKRVVVEAELLRLMILSKLLKANTMLSSISHQLNCRIDRGE